MHMGIMIMVDHQQKPDAEASQMSRLLADESGGMLAEYVLITVLIVLPLDGVGSYMFNTDGTITGNDFGVFGNALVDSYRKIMCGICLPIP